MSGVELREVAELLERLKGRAADDPFVVTGLATLRGREKSVERALSLGPAWRAKLAAERLAGIEAASAGTGRPRSTRCKHGHPLAGPNLLVELDGRRRCRSCARHQRRAWGR